MWTQTYRRGAELPGLTLPWQEETSDGEWADLDLSSGYTFTLTLVAPDQTDTAMTDTVIGGHDGYVTVAWAADDLDIAPSTYLFKLRARETATSKDRDYSPGKWPAIVITA